MIDRLVEHPGVSGKALSQKDIIKRLPDIGSFLIQKNNPPNSSGGLDYRRCAALHNYIMHYLEESMDGRLALGSRCHSTWYDGLPDTIQSTFHQKMKPEVINFLKSCLHNRQLNFFFGKAGLNKHEDMIKSIDQYKPGTFVLYRADRGPIHPYNGKVLYDQVKCKAIVIPETAHSGYVERECLWRPLEVILSAWVEMIHVGKMTSTLHPNLEIARGQLEAVILNKWASHSFGQSQPLEAVQAFDELVNAIHRRMIAGAHVTQVSDGKTAPLFDRPSLSAARIPKRCFAEFFLLKISTPPEGILYLAPGIRAPFRDMVNQFQQQLLRPGSSGDVRAIMLFPVDDIAEVSQLKQIEKENGDNVDGTTGSHSGSGVSDEDYSVPLDEILLPPGIHSAAARRGADNAEEGFIFVLPFALKNSGICHKSDGCALPKHNETNVYQHGFKPCGGDKHRPHRLVKLLENWTMMVNHGHWNVDEKGVSGGINVFKDALSKGLAHLYNIEADW